MKISEIILELEGMQTNISRYNDFIVENNDCSLSKKFLISESIFKVITLINSINDLLQKIKEKP